MANKYYKDVVSSATYERYMELECDQDFDKWSQKLIANAKLRYGIDIELIEIDYNEYLRLYRPGFRPGHSFGHIQLTDSQGNAVSEAGKIYNQLRLEREESN